jgi:hypothetical protein
MKNYFLSLLALCLATPAFTQILRTYAGDGTAAYGGDGGLATAAQIDEPIGVYYDASGNVYITEYNGHRIRKVSPTGIISTIAGTGIAGYNGDGIPATAAQLKTPMSITGDASGNLYFSDYDNNRIRKIDAAGIISTYAGNGTIGYGGDGSAATAAQLNNPKGLVIDNTGNMYVADFYNHRIRKIDASGIITTFAGNGSGSFSADGVPATASELNFPSDVAMDTGGNLLIADYLNHRIRKVDATGIIHTVAGYGTGAYSGDGGPATSAALNNPRSIAVDDSNNIYIADLYNHRIRKVSEAGIITTIAGTGVSAYGGFSATAATSPISYPSSICMGGGQDLYFVDGYRIRLYTCPPPVAGPITGADSVCMGDSILLADTTAGGYWTAAGSNITVSGSGFVTGITTGTDTIIYTVTNTCASTRAKKAITVYDCNTGVHDLSVHKVMLAISPNPAQNQIFLKSTKPIGKVSIYDIAGRTLYEGTHSSSQAAINLAPLPSGMYLLKDNDNHVYRFMKE